MASYQISSLSNIINSIYENMDDLDNRVETLETTISSIVDGDEVSY